MKKDKIYLAIIIIVIIILLFANAKQYKIFHKEPKITIKDNTITLRELSLRQKIGQMMIVYAKPENKEWINKNNIGGIWIHAEPSREAFEEKIQYFQKNSTIKLFVAADLEGGVTPFDNFQTFSPPAEIKTKEEAYQMGKTHGKFLNELGFNLNFAPVVDLNDTIWHYRTFNGTPEEVAEKAIYYIKGLKEEGIISTIKHYPGRTLEGLDPHQELLITEIRRQDAIPFYITLNQSDSIMISHQITSGVFDSKGKPAVVSNLVNEIAANSSGLIITDEIGMEGLKKYFKTDKERYAALLTVSNDVILIFHRDTEVLDDFIDTIEKSVRKGEITEQRIDRSVKKILQMKGYIVE